MSLARRDWAVVIAIAILLTAVTHVVVTSRSPDTPNAATAAEPKVAVDDVQARRLPARLLVRSVNPEAPRADGALVELSPDGAVTPVAGPSCKRVAVSPGGSGICLRISRNGIDYEALLFDKEYRPVTRVPIKGVPDRARVSPDGRYAAYTSFDAEEAQGYFESPDEFTTYTRILDMRDGHEVLDLDDLAFTRYGKPFRAHDAELWGVTFARGGRFYATMATASRHYLIAGRAGGRVARIVASDVECPALSPDGTRIAYKRRVSETVVGLRKPIRWRFYVMALDTGRRVRLAERRSIDDQPEWLGNQRIVYSNDKDLFTVPADGSGTPARLASNATSASPLDSSS